MSKKQSNNIVYLRLTRPFVGLPNDTICSKELNSLGVHSRWLFMVMLTRFDRKKEKIHNWYRFTYEELKEIIHYDERTITKAIHQLEDNDFIQVEHGGKNNPSKYRPIVKWLC